MLRQIWGRNARNLQQCNRLDWSVQRLGPKPLNFYHSTAVRHAKYVRFSSPIPDPNPNKSRDKRSFFQDRSWPTKVGAGFFGLATAFYIYSLEKVPETGRWRFMAVSPETEASLGELVHQQTLAQYKNEILPDQHPLTLHVKRVVQNVLDASQLGTVKGYTQQSPQSYGGDFMNDNDWSNPSSSRSSSKLGLGSTPSAIASSNKEWSVIVVDDRKIVNAAATPGTVIVFTGILPVCKDEQGLAAVLSHEIGHVVARHTAERLSSQSIAIAFTIFLLAIGVDVGLSSVMQKILLELPNSRTQEREADLIGLRLMSKACYDPKASPGMFARLGQLEGSSSRSFTFFNTHPSTESRVRDLEARLEEGYAIRAANPKCSDGLADQLHAFVETTKKKNIFDLGGSPPREVQEETVWR
ncbi:peptidase family M48-domain-containing protein [Rhodocollybia butyracea]|uniref:Peptidase family M48-domain-containing protein n=1 Tax=Rhodocollybia butyracea TaxID=206335 RepID=A0A9P5UFH8_9AGAR|nr:peptidase family M48-domain-containing protein [Rhodocollybia butyracea]